MGCICDIFKKRKFSKVGHADINFEKPTELTDEQKIVIRNNWRTLNSQIANIGVFTFISMFESRPELKETFELFKGKNVDEIHNTGLLRKHALRVMSTIDKCISRLDQPSSMTCTLRKIGVHHIQYKVPVAYLEIILPHFLEAIKPQLEAFWCDDLEEAWTRLFNMIFYHIREGMVRNDNFDTISVSGTVT